MCDNNLYDENEILVMNNNSINFLTDLVIEYQNQLLLIDMMIKEKSYIINEKEIELREIEQTKDKNMDLFSPIYSKKCDTSQIMSYIKKIRDEIDNFNQQKANIEGKINGIQNALHCINNYHKCYEENKKSEIQANEKRINENGLEILEAQEVERQRIARELHDSTVQNLTSLVHKSELCIKLIDIDAIRAKLELNSMSNTLKVVINDMRGIIYNLKPMTLDDLGLTVTVQRFANRIMNLNSIQVKVIANEETSNILSVIKLTLFRVIQEACNNTIKHAQANLIIIDINYQEDKINVAIKDNGIGFNKEEISKRGTEQQSSFGLSNMKERISLLSGALDIISDLGSGTIVTISVPIAKYEGSQQ
jgi:Signal transduction histidine kinase